MGATFSTPCVRVRRVCCYPTPRQLTTRLVQKWSLWLFELVSLVCGRRRNERLPFPPAPCCLQNTPLKQDDVPAEIHKTSGRLIWRERQQRKVVLREKLSSHTKQNLSEKCCFRANLKWSLIILVNLVIIPVIKMINNAWDLTNKKCKQNESI